MNARQGCLDDVSETATQTWERRLEQDGPTSFISKLASCVFGPDEVEDEYHDDLQVGWNVYRESVPGPYTGTVAALGAFFIGLDIKRERLTRTATQPAQMSGPSRH